MMVVFTCTDLGETAVNEVVPIVSAKLAEAKGAGLAAIQRSGWELLGIGFQDQIVLIHMSIKTENHLVIPATSDPHYSQTYAEKCGKSAPPLQPRSIGEPPPAATTAPSTQGTVGQGEVVRPGGLVSPPVVISRVEPQYSEEARRASCEGITMLEAAVRKDGTADTLRVVRSAGCASSDQAAIQAVKQWRFKPGMKDGMPVDVILNIEISSSRPR